MDRVVRSDIQPTVINLLTLQEAIRDQGPKGEAGKLFEEEGYNFNDVSHLRLEFLSKLN